VMVRYIPVLSGNVYPAQHAPLRQAARASFNPIKGD
jgi:hypothetical protein